MGDLLSSTTSDGETAPPTNSSDPSTVGGMGKAPRVRLSGLYPLGFPRMMTQIIPFDSNLPLLAPSFFSPFPFFCLFLLLSLPFFFFLSPSPGPYVRHLVYYTLACTHAHTHTTTHAHTCTCTHTHTHTHTASVRQPEIHCPMRLSTDLCLCNPLTVPPHLPDSYVDFRIPGLSSLSGSPPCPLPHLDCCSSWTAVLPQSPCLSFTALLALYCNFICSPTKHSHRGRGAVSCTVISNSLRPHGL